MCGRYKLEDHWQEYCADPFFDWSDPPYPFDNPFKAIDEACPRDRMPIVRRDADGRLVVELRQWGYILMVAGRTLDAAGRPKRVRRDVFNAMSEKLTTSHAWKWSFLARRCLIPMSSWDEWPQTAAGKQRVRVSMPARKVFMAAGLYDVGHDPKTGEAIPLFTMCTVPPNEFLGTVHDRAPMVLEPERYADWLEGGAAAARLVGTHPDASAFAVTIV